MNEKEAIKDIVCALIASGDYTYGDDSSDFETAVKLGWNSTWHGSVVEHAKNIFYRIESSVHEDQEDGNLISYDAETR